MEQYIDFEKRIASLERKLEDLRDVSENEGVDLQEEIQALEAKVSSLIDETFSNLTSWQRVQLSRHPNRPYFRDYLDELFPDFVEIHGDRGYGDDPAIMSGIATWPPQTGKKELNGSAKNRQSFVVIGHQKGRTTKQKMHRNFGMAKPEGYRKAMRLMDMAEKFRMPILTFIDTPGAYPGIETEERGQAQIIAECLQKMASLTVPVLSVVIGEGGSGGALAIGVANRVLMMEYSTYSVISPEGCASILWSDASYAEKASDVLKITAKDLLKLKVVDGVVTEPKGGAHRDWKQTFDNMRKKLSKEMQPMFEQMNQGKKSAASEKLGQEIKMQRFEKFREIGKPSMTKSTQRKAKK